MVGAAACVGGESADLGPVHLRRERRGQLVGDEHRGLVDLAEQVSRHRHTLSQVHPETAHQIGHIALSLAQIGIGDLVEDGAEPVEYLLNRPFRVDVLFTHDVSGMRHQHRIVQHQQLRVEQRRQFGAALRHAGPDVEKLFPRGGAAVVETLQLVLDARRRNAIAEHLRALDEDHRASRDDARRDADALQALH